MRGNDPLVSSGTLLGHSRENSCAFLANAWPCTGLLCSVQLMASATCLDRSLYKNLFLYFISKPACRDLLVSNMGELAVYDAHYSQGGTWSCGKGRVYSKSILSLDAGHCCLELMMQELGLGIQPIYRHFLVHFC